MPRPQRRRKSDGIRISSGGAVIRIPRGPENPEWPTYRQPEKPGRLQIITTKLVELLKLPDIETLEAEAFGSSRSSGRQIPPHLLSVASERTELQGWLEVYGKKNVIRRARRLAYDVVDDYALVRALRYEPNSLARRKVLGHIATKRLSEQEDYGNTPPGRGENGYLFVAIQETDTRAPIATDAYDSSEEMGHIIHT